MPPPFGATPNPHPSWPKPPSPRCYVPLDPALLLEARCGSSEERMPTKTTRRVTQRASRGRRACRHHVADDTTRQRELGYLLWYPSLFQATLGDRGIIMFQTTLRDRGKDAKGGIPRTSWIPKEVRGCGRVGGEAGVEAKQEGCVAGRQGGKGGWGGRER